MKQVKVFVEKAAFGYSAYMEDAGLDYGCNGEGKTVEEAIDDFRKAYDDIRCIISVTTNRLRRSTTISSMILPAFFKNTSKPSAWPVSNASPVLIKHN